jgi:hypothetical protein
MPPCVPSLPKHFRSLKKPDTWSAAGSIRSTKQKPGIGHVTKRPANLRVPLPADSVAYMQELRSSLNSQDIDERRVALQHVCRAACQRADVRLKALHLKEQVILRTSVLLALLDACKISSADELAVVSKLVEFEESPTPLRLACPEWGLGRHTRSQQASIAPDTLPKSRAAAWRSDAALLSSTDMLQRAGS